MKKFKPGDLVMVDKDMYQLITTILSNKEKTNVKTQEVIQDSMKSKLIWTFDKDRMWVAIKPSSIKAPIRWLYISESKMRHATKEEVVAESL